MNEQKHIDQLNKNRYVVGMWNKQLQEWDREELINEVILCWSQQGLDGYKTLTKL
jgi:hypothetical protein